MPDRLVAWLPACRCVSGTQLGFQSELIITNALPIISVLFLVLVAMVVVPCAGHPHSCRGAEHMFAALVQRHELWDLVLFFFLLEYPVIARKSLSAFDCLDIGQ